MAKTKGIDIHHPNMVKTVFIMTSLAILAFLALIVKTTSFPSIPQAGGACEKVLKTKSLGEITKNCKPASSCKITKVTKKGKLLHYKCTSKSENTQSNSNTAGGVGGVIKPPTAGSTPNQSCIDKYGFQKNGYYTNEPPSDCSSSSTHKFLLGTARVTNKSKLYAPYNCCITASDFQIEADQYCESLKLVDENGKEIPLKKAYKCKVLDSNRCNKATDTDSNNVASKDTYKTGTNEYSECYTAQSKTSTQKLRGLCCMKAD